MKKNKRNTLTNNTTELATTDVRNALTNHEPTTQEIRYRIVLTSDKV